MQLLECDFSGFPVVRHIDTAVPVQHPGSVSPAALGKKLGGTPSEWGFPASFQ